MHASLDNDPGHQAVARLFDLAREGATDAVEFNQLDSLVYARFVEAYAGEPGSGQAA